MEHQSRQTKIPRPNATEVDPHVIGAAEWNRVTEAALRGRWPGSFSNGRQNGVVGLLPLAIEEFEISSLTSDTGDTEDSKLYLGKPRSYDHVNAVWVADDERGPLRIDGSDIDALLEVGDKIHCWWDWQRQFWIPFAAIGVKSVAGACNALIEAQALNISIDLDEGSSGEVGTGTHVSFALEKNNQVIQDRSFVFALVEDARTGRTGFVTFRASNGDQITLSACLGSGSSLDAEITGGTIRLEAKCKVTNEDQTDQTVADGARPAAYKFVKGFVEAARIRNGPNTGQPRFTVRNSLIEIETPDDDDWMIEAEFAVSANGGLLSSSSSSSKSSSSQSSQSSSQSASSQSSSSLSASISLSTSSSSSGSGV